MEQNLTPIIKDSFIPNATIFFSNGEIITDIKPLNNLREIVYVINGKENDNGTKTNTYN